MNTKNILLTVALAAVLVSAAVPAVEAQSTLPASLQLTVSDIGGPITPGIESRGFKIQPIYTFTSTAQNAITPVAGIATVNIAFTCPAGVVVSGPGNIVIPVNAASGSAGTSYKGPNTDYYISVARSVPGLVTLQCTVSATTEGLNSAAAGKASYSQPLSFSADYYGLVSVSIENKINDAGPQKQIPYAIQFTNFGNAKTQVNFELVGETPGKWQPIIPDPVILDSASTAGGTTTGTRTFSIGTPYHNGWNNEETTFTLKMTPTSADVPAKTGSVQQATVLARVRGIYVPSVEPVAMLGALVGAVMLARARKDE